MRKYMIFVMLLAFIVAATTGCDLIVKDAEVDAQTVIIEVAGVEIVKEDVQEAVESVLDYQEYIYSMYGLSFDRTDADSVASAQESAIESLIEEAVVNQKISEYELDQFTESELESLTEAADETYTYYADYVELMYFSDSELTGNELDAAVDAMLVSLGYGTQEDVLEQEKQSEALSKLKELVVADVTVTQEEIETQYNEGLASAITTYASDLTQYADDLDSGSIIYFQPDGYRYIKNLLILLSDEDQTEIETLTSLIADDEDTLAAVEDAISELPEDSAEDTEDQQKTRAELIAQVDTLTAEIESATAELETVTANAYSAIEATVSLVVEKMEAGEEFDSLIEEYGEDTGMQSEPEKTTGYLVCAGLSTYVDEFVEASMALENIGDISDPFRTSYGIHIVQYVSDLHDGEVALDDINDEISEELLAEKQDTFYNETVSQWVTDADAKTYIDRLAD